MESLTVATYNVHMWGDADFEDNFDRVLKIVKVLVLFKIISGHVDV
jgi:hypothetical protein